MPIKVLIVLDGVYRFAEPHDTLDFTYTTLVGALNVAGMQVTKAHRRADGTADIQNFAFTPATINTNLYDAAWLIGFEGRNDFNNPPSGHSTMGGLGPPQLNAIANFMDAGGGVFATGDHDSIGSDMSGYLPRIRAMRAWYGASDSASPMPVGFPTNNPPMSPARADTIQLNPAGHYSPTPDGSGHTFAWFENQSDSIPQPIVPSHTPAHPILRSNGRDVVVYPDHMHEGVALGTVAGYDYAQASPFGVTSQSEFRAISGHRETPSIIATGQVLEKAVFTVDVSPGTDPTLATPKTVNILSAYDGRVAGVGRIVTGSTFHHYIDINLTGDTDVNTNDRRFKTGPDAEKGHGFNDNTAVFNDIKAVFVNITHWLARPRPAIQLILERNTFGQDEATANPNFDAAILVAVDGLKPNQFPGGPVNTTSPSAAQLAAWAPVISLGGGSGITITPTAVASDDPILADRLQRFTFTYRVSVNAGTAFGLAAPDVQNVPVSASLTSIAAPAPLTDAAWIELVKSANPFMLDLANGNQTAWLSSDVRVFPVVVGRSKFGHTLPMNATRAQALSFLQTVVSGMSVSDFEGLESDEDRSALSPFPLASDGSKVYNFAVARVRRNGTTLPANDVRLFFRMFTSQTTAALMYHESGGVPIDGYPKTPGAAPVALPGTTNGGTEWLSFPFFAESRVTPPSAQSDTNNVKTIGASEHNKFFGALIDNNLAGPYLPSTPISGGPAQPLPTLMMGEHQCIVAQIEFSGTPIHDGATPWTSDKLSQRNLALSLIANPGLNASRVAMHTFEIEATPHAIAEGIPPDEVLLAWKHDPLDGTFVRLFIPSWDASKVIELADHLYPRHELRAVDAHTIEVPGGGMRYVPIPQSLQRQTGVITAEFPLGVKKGQRFDLSVRQVSNRNRNNVPPVIQKTQRISLQEAERLLQDLKRANAELRVNDAGLPRGAFDLGNNRTLVTDLSLFDAAGDHALIIEHPDPKELARARKDSTAWRQTIGAFQLGIPVSVKADMLLYHLRLLSVLRWRADTLRPKNRWYASFMHYVELLAEKVRALGGDPYSVPPTPDGIIPQLPGKDEDDDDGAECHDQDAECDVGGDHGGHGHGITGKVHSLIYDHFGDFEGFLIETNDGSHHRLLSRETAIRDLASRAWIERNVVTALTVSAHSRRVRRLWIGGHQD